MDSDDRFYDASLQSDETVFVHPQSKGPTAWWLAYTIALTILAAIVAIVLVIMCASSFILLGLAGWSKRWLRLRYGNGREPGAGSVFKFKEAGTQMEFDPDAGRRHHPDIRKSQ